jgi:hypothetical protein
MRRNFIETGQSAGDAGTDVGPSVDRSIGEPPRDVEARIFVRQSPGPGGWHVIIAWPDGRQERVNGFLSRDECEAWVRNDSAHWLSLRLDPSNRSAPK